MVTIFQYPLESESRVFSVDPGLVGQGEDREYYTVWQDNGGEVVAVGSTDSPVVNLVHNGLHLFGDVYFYKVYGGKPVDLSPRDIRDLRLLVGETEQPARRNPPAPGGLAPLLTPIRGR